MIVKVLLWLNLILGVLGVAYALWCRFAFKDETFEEDVCSYCEDSGHVYYPGSSLPAYCSCARGPARRREDAEDKRRRGEEPLETTDDHSSHAMETMGTDGEPTAPVIKRGGCGCSGVAA